MTEEPVDRALSGGNIRQSYLFEALASEYPTDLLTTGGAPDEHARKAAENVIQLPVRPGVWTENPIGRRALLLAITFGSP